MSEISSSAVLPGALPASNAAMARARWCTRILFCALGILAGAWGSHIPSVKAEYGLGEAQISFVLLAAAFGAVFSLFFAGRVVGRLGARNAAVVAATSMSAMLALVLVWPNLVVLLLSMLIFGAAMSLFDVAINTEGTVLETLGGLPIMSSLHGMFSVGGMIGAGVCSAMLHADVAPVWQLVGIGSVIALGVAVASRGMLEAHPQGDSADAHFAWPRGLLLVIGLLIFAGMTSEGVMYDWSVLYLKQEVGMPQAQAALGYSAFSAAMALARFCGDPLRQRYSERALLRFGAALAAVSMAVVLVVGTPWVALIGFALVGAGLAPVAPILFTAATRVPGVSGAAAIASVTSIGYCGFMIGPPLIGGIAQASSLTLALAVLVVAATVLALSARYIPEAKRGA